MSEWRYRPVPAGIANTASGLLQRDKKTSVFARSSAPVRESTPHLASRRVRTARVTRGVARARNAMLEFLRVRENVDNIWVSEAFGFHAIAATAARARNACDRKMVGNRALSISNDLCKKFSVKRLAKAVQAADSDRNRANRLELIRSRATVHDRGRHGQPNNFAVRRFVLSSVRRRPFRVVISRACA